MACNRANGLRHRRTELEAAVRELILRCGTGQAMDTQTTQGLLRALYLLGRLLCPLDEAQSHSFRSDLKRERRITSR